MRTRITATLAMGLTLKLATSLQAADTCSHEEEIIPPSSWGIRAFALGDSTLKGEQASYAISSVSLELAHRHWTLGLERQYFDWNHGDAFSEQSDGRDPWEFLNRLQLGFSHQHIHSSRWSSQVLAGAIMGFEDEITDSVSGYLGGYGACQISPNMVLLFGLYYSRHPDVETDFDCVPILGLLLNPSQTQGWSAQLGLPTTKTSWHFDERTRLVLELNTLEGGVTRLADDSPVSERGYLELANAALTLRLETRLGENLDVSAGIGHSIDRKLKIYDADGNHQRTVDIERGPSIEIAIRKPF